MERDNKKRAREEAEDKKDFIVKTSKKQDVHDRSCFIFSQVVEAQDESETNNNNNISSSSSSSNNNYLGGLGVFDFPWLHNDEGMISNKSEEWNFQETFSSSLDDPTCTGVEFSRQYLCETEAETTTTITSMMNFPDINKFEENVWPVFKGDQQEEEEDDDNQLGIANVDCIWSSMINQPLQ